MDPKNLYVLFYKSGVKGASSGFITASSLKKAEELGQHFCNSHMNYRYIRTESAILADEAELEPAPAPVAPSTVGTSPVVDRPQTSPISGKKER